MKYLYLAQYNEYRIESMPSPINFADYLNLSECSSLKDQYMGFSLTHYLVFNTFYRLEKKTLDALKLKANK